MDELKSDGLGFSDDQIEKMSKAVTDMVTAYTATWNQVTAALRAAIVPVIDSMSALWNNVFPEPTRAEIRNIKLERRRERHYFMTHGKHGVKRPK